MTLFDGQQPMMVQPRPQTNGLGVASFVVSMIGLLVTGGVLCPIGAILGLIAMGREPRGWAIAGLVVGLIGSCGIIVAVFFFGVAILAALGLAAVAIAMTEPQKVQITSDMMRMAVAIKAYQAENDDFLPADLGLLDLEPHVLVDPWQNDYEYELLDVDRFDLVSAGADGTFETDDDIRLSELNETWKPGGVGVEVNETEGTVRIRLGDRTFTATGDDDEGIVTVDLGDRTIEIVGDDDGGSVNVIPKVPADEGAPGDDDGHADAEEHGGAERGTEPPPP